MPKFTLGVTAKVMLDMQGPSQIFRAQGQAEYDNHMLENKDQPLPPGPAVPFVNKLLGFNSDIVREETDVVLLSKSSFWSSGRIDESIHHHTGKYLSGCFTTGRPAGIFAQPGMYDCDLVFGANEDEVRDALEKGIPAVCVSPDSNPNRENNGKLIIGFDIDNTLTDSTLPEGKYLTDGKAAYCEYESTHRYEPLPDGPLKRAMFAFSRLKHHLGEQGKNIELRYITARGNEAKPRVLATFQAWRDELKTSEGIDLAVDVTHFLNGRSKQKFIEGCDLFVDDGRRHVAAAAEVTLAGHVVWGVSNPRKPVLHRHNAIHQDMLRQPANAGVQKEHRYDLRSQRRHTR